MAYFLWLLFSKFVWFNSSFSLRRNAITFFIKYTRKNLGNNAGTQQTADFAWKFIVFRQKNHVVNDPLIFSVRSRDATWKNSARTRCGNCFYDVWSTRGGRSFSHFSQRRQGSYFEKEWNVHLSHGLLRDWKQSSYPEAPSRCCEFICPFLSPSSNLKIKKSGKVVRQSNKVLHSKIQKL